MAIVNGKLQTRTWEDKDGNKRKAVEIVADNVYFGDSKQSDDAPKKASTQEFTSIADDSGDLPF
jgi:single-strand DNA-binding protein